MKRNIIFSWIELLLSFVGAGIAGTIYYAHAKNIDLPCMTGSGCDMDHASRWSHLFGFDVAMLGFIGYAILGMLSVLKLTIEGDSIAKLRLGLLAISGGGFAYSWYLQYVSIVNVGVICSWCMSSAITMTLLFFCVVVDLVGEGLKKRRDAQLA
jgi:uncharacterized membrane protein